MAHSFSLSLAAVDILLDHGKLGSAPFPFQLPHMGTTHGQRTQIRDAVFRDLESRGLFSRGRLDADTELALRTFANAPLAIGCVAKLDGDEKVFARAASDSQFAVLVKRDENVLVFTEVRPSAVVPSIVDLIPLKPAAGGQSVTIARQAPQQPRRRQDDDSYDPFAGVAKPRSTANPQQRLAERIFEKPRVRIGQFAAAVRGRDGKPVALPVLSWFDTEDGRYFCTTRISDDGQQWITYAPGDNARIGRQLQEQVQPYLG